jgi:hypothetical protein
MKLAPCGIPGIRDVKIDALAPSTEHYGVRSLSLEEIVGQGPTPPLFVRIARFGKVLLIAWGAISLGAAGGVAAYYLGGSATPLLVSDAEAPPAPSKSTPATSPQAARLANDDIGSGGANMFAPADLPTTLSASSPILEARLPRPRPEEPVITGSISRPAYDPNYAPPIRRRVVDPCTALRNLGAPIRCGSPRRVYGAPSPALAPPPVVYVPQPYHPPVVARP